MKRLNKNEMIMVRLTRDQHRRLKVAAKTESSRRGEHLPPATFARELIFQGLDQRETAQQPEPATAGSPA